MTITSGRCNARGCFKCVRHDKLFCVEHWRHIPQNMRQQIIEYYTVGQDSGDNICTPTWIGMVNEAIDHLERMGVVSQ